MSSSRSRPNGSGSSSKSSGSSRHFRLEYWQAAAVVVVFAAFYGTCVLIETSIPYPLRASGCWKKTTNVEKTSVRRSKEEPGGRNRHQQAPERNFQPERNFRLHYFITSSPHSGWKFRLGACWFLLALLLAHSGFSWFLRLLLTPPLALLALLCSSWLL